MRNYSYCVRNKKTNKYVSLGVRHELEFLDYMAMQFTDKEKLMSFLGVDLEKYDDIEIEYKVGNKKEIIPVIFDPQELNYIAEELVLEPFNYLVFNETRSKMATLFSELKEADRTIIGYNYPETISVYKDNRTLRTMRIHLKPIYRALLEHGVINKAFMLGLVTEEAYKKYDSGDILGFIDEISKDYLSIRNACVAAATINGRYITPEYARTPRFPYKSLEDVTKDINPVFDSEFYDLLINSKLTASEQNCIASFLFFGNNLLGDDPNHKRVDAYKAIRKLAKYSSDLKKLLKYIDEKQESLKEGNVKKLGTIIDN